MKYSHDSNPWWRNVNYQCGGNMSWVVWLKTDGYHILTVGKPVGPVNRERLQHIWQWRWRGGGGNGVNGVGLVVGTDMMTVGHLSTYLYPGWIVSLNSQWIHQNNKEDPYHCHQTLQTRNWPLNGTWLKTFVNQNQNSVPMKDTGHDMSPKCALKSALMSTIGHIS